VGLYAGALLAARPELPVAEARRLNDPGLRDNFIERVFAYRRWRALLAAGLTSGRLVEFHDSHRLALMAHGVQPARRLGRLVAAAGKTPRARLAADYGAAFMELLRRKAAPRLHANVLRHLMGYLKGVLDAEDEAELLQAIDAYRLGEAPRIVPITLLRHHFRRNPHPYVTGQTYLEARPAEWMLRGGV
jgi:uncharacterized protein YbgA (DUF1722 family)